MGGLKLRKSMIGLILTIIGVVIIFLTLSLNTMDVFLDSDAMYTCYLMLLIGGVFLMLGTFILAERLKGWARR